MASAMMMRDAFAIFVISSTAPIGALYIIAPRCTIYDPECETVR